VPDHRALQAAVSSLRLTGLPRAGVPGKANRLRLQKEVRRRKNLQEAAQEGNKQLKAQGKRYPKDTGLREKVKNLYSELFFFGHLFWFDFVSCL